MNSLFSALTEGDLKRIGAVVLIILANFVFAVVGAVVKGGFDPAAGGLDTKKLPEFFTKQVLPYVLGLAFFEAFLHVVGIGDTVSALFGKTSPVVDAAGALVPPPDSFAWLDPAALWTIYGAMVANLTKQLLVNLFFLIGKTSEAASAIAKK